MRSKAGLDFILHVTNYFQGKWEDPGWGRMPINQVLTGLAIRELANGIEDPELRGAIQAATDRAVVKNAQGVAKG